MTNITLPTRGIICDIFFVIWFSFTFLYVVVSLRFFFFFKLGISYLRYLTKFLNPSLLARITLARPSSWFLLNSEFVLYQKKSFFLNFHYIIIIIKHYFK
jgi:hypothetical protein